MTEKKKICTSGSFILCDVQKEYADQLLKILAERFAGEYQFHLFYDFEKMKRFVEKSSHTDILMIAEEFEAGEDGYPEAEKILILTSIPVRKGEEKENRIFRYQSADGILDDIIRAAGKEEVVSSDEDQAKGPAEEGERELMSGPAGTVSAGSGRKKGGIRIRDKPPDEKQRTVKGLIGVYSPIHRIGKTKFAIRLGQKMARNGPVLYLNMEGYSGNDYYFQDNSGKSIGDLLYCLKQEREDHGIRISAMTGQAGGMDYLLPMENERDLREVKAEEWIGLLDEVAEKCIYETIILDLGESVDGIYDILRKCSRVYTPYIREGAAAAKLEQYENNLRSSGYGDILKRTVKKEMRRVQNSVRATAGRDERIGSL